MKSGCRSHMKICKIWPSPFWRMAKSGCPPPQMLPPPVMISEWYLYRWYTVRIFQNQRPFNHALNKPLVNCNPWHLDYETFIFHCISPQITIFWQVLTKGMIIGVAKFSQICWRFAGQGSIISHDINNVTLS